MVKKNKCRSLVGYKILEKIDIFVIKLRKKKTQQNRKLNWSLVCLNGFESY